MIVLLDTPKYCKLCMVWLNRYGDELNMHTFFNLWEMCGVRTEHYDYGNINESMCVYIFCLFRRAIEK